MKSIFFKGKIILFSLTAINFFFYCKSVPDYKQFRQEALEIINEAKKLQKEEKLGEACRLAMLVNDFEGENDTVKSILNSCNEQERTSVDPSEWLGFNKSKRIKITNVSIFEKVLWYIPDRVGDFFDLISVTVTTGPHWGASVWVTRAGQISAYGGGSVGLGYFQKRNIGVKAEASGEIGIGPLVPTAILGARAGTNGLDYIPLTKDIFHKPSDDLYQEYRDYWGVGAKVGLAIIGLEIEIHPVEFYDFVGGFLLFDVGNDDWSTTKYLRIPMELNHKLKKFYAKRKQFDKKKYQEENYSKS